MVFTQSGVEVVICEVVLVGILVGDDRSRLRLLLQVLDIGRGVSSLELSQVVAAPVLSLPQ